MNELTYAVEVHLGDFTSAIPVAAEKTDAPGPARVITGAPFRSRGRCVTFEAEPAPPISELVRRPAKVAKLLALSHKLQDGINRGAFAGRASVARGIGFTRAHTTQLLDLTPLAPDLQEHVRELEAVDGVEPVSEAGREKSSELSSSKKRGR